MNQRTLLFACSLSLLAGAQAHADPLRDISRPSCSSVDADHQAGAPQLSSNCQAPLANERRDQLEVKLRAAPGTVTFGDFTVNGAHLYNDQFVPELWSLDPGDTLRVSLENALTEAVGAVTNLHTHGLIVSPNNAGGTDLDQPLGDNTYVLVTNGEAQPHQHMTSTATGHIPIRQIDRTAEYLIPIPADHPSGLFWYHAHPHGRSENQLGGGLSGLITIGLPADYARPADDGQEIEHRFLMLKDVQLTRAAGDDDWRLNKVLDWRFCNDASGEIDRRIAGACLNGDNAAWLFTVNGQLYPTIEVDQGTPQLWRIANTSPNVTYRLQLAEIAADGSEQLMSLQVVSVDGVAIGQSADSGPILRQTLLVMPSARIELYVAYDDGTGRTVPASGARAVLRQAGFLTGEKPGEGDTWPAIDLAEVVFKPHADRSQPPAPHFIAVEADSPGGGATAISTASDDGCPHLGPDETRIVAFDVRVYARDKRAGVDFPMPPSCAPDQSDGTYYNIIGTGVATIEDSSSLDGILAAYDAAIGMKYAGDVNGEPVATRGKCFDEALDTCVPYPSVETWWVVNASNEAHNFHIHQTRFQVLEVLGPPSDLMPIAPGVYHDNFPVLVGQAVKVRIPFDRPEQIGTYVYHCHILQHEDQGMMAAIEVRQTPN